MRLTHLADYAVVMMTAAARRGAMRVSAAELAQDTGVPLPTAQKLMGQLASAGLLSSVRGAGGGFTLARPVTEISLADIVEAVEGPIAMTMCSGGDQPSECALDAHCRVKPHMGIVSNAVRGALGAVSLEALSKLPSAVRPEPVEGLSLSSARGKTVLRQAQHERSGISAGVAK
ncbi:SUF system Fe-S cluster assembly regulator [Sphingomonas sp.]|uniref:SUF system Fe-S cluster assembly regulator n=1 Tax=Sphingomonas sp. TaxID=28214 RepID=UPI001823EAC6|nr:SUF system Fe-S cluster assembly regulator [Sphingomonas sp.]